MMRLHASCVAIEGRGVLLAGPSGAGKSDLALRLIDGGAALVSDDQVELFMKDGRLWAAAPPALEGLLEIRGVGLVRLPFIGAVPVDLYVDLVAFGTQVARLPGPEIISLLDQPVRRFRVEGLSPAAPAIVRALLSHEVLDVP